MTPVFAQVGPAWLMTWLTPMWILGVGALVGLIILAMLWAVLFVVARRTALDIPDILTEGPMLPILIVTIVFAVFGVAGAVVVRTPFEVIASVPRFMHTGEQNLAYQVPVTADNAFHEEALQFEVVGTELSVMRIQTDQPIYLGNVMENQTTSEMLYIEPGNEFEWIRGKESISPIGDDPVTRFAIANEGGGDARVNVQVITEPIFPESWAMVVTALSVIGIFVVYVLQNRLFPKMMAVALSTAKSEMGQPFFMIIMGLGAFLLFIFMFIPYNTFGEDIKMLKDSGFTTIMILAIIHAVWAASSSVADEIDGKTALTLLSKPVSRWQFVLGKFMGIVWSVAVIFVVLGAFFVLLIAYKPIYDARESAKLTPIWQDSYVEVVRTVPGLILAFLETVVLTSVSVAISTRLPLLPNFAICFAIYTLGHLTPLLVQSAVGSLPPVAFMGIFISAVLPMLEAFNIQAAVAGGREVPYEYLALSLYYCFLYSLVAMLLALILFEDRDLA